MQNYMGFLVNDSDMNSDPMGFLDFSELFDTVTTSAAATLEQEAKKAADEQIKKLLGTDKGTTTTQPDGTIIIQKESQPIYQYMTQPSTIPKWVWITMGVMGVSLFGVVVYRLVRK